MFTRYAWHNEKISKEKAYDFTLNSRLAQVQVGHWEVRISPHVAFSIVFIITYSHLRFLYLHLSPSQLLVAVYFAVNKKDKEEY